MTQNLTHSLDELETEVMETLDNPTPSFLVNFPYVVSFTMPQDGHATKVTLETRSETICTAQDEDEVRRELKSHQPDFNTFYVERLIKWLPDNDLKSSNTICALCWRHAATNAFAVTWTASSAYDFRLESRTT